MNSGRLSEAETQHLDKIGSALDPVRLLQQIQFLQVAFWRHAVIESGKTGRLIDARPVRYRFLNAPEFIAQALLQQLRQKHPGQFLDNQVRTLQRRVNLWRWKMILEFDDLGIGDPAALADTPSPTMRGVSAPTVGVEVQ